MPNHAFNSVLSTLRSLVRRRRSHAVSLVLAAEAQAQAAPRTVNDLRDGQRVELLALTKIVGSWAELDAEFNRRGYEIAQEGEQLYLVELHPKREVVCEMADLGFGATLRDLSMRYGGRRDQA